MTTNPIEINMICRNTDPDNPVFPAIAERIIAIPKMLNMITEPNNQKSKFRQLSFVNINTLPFHQLTTLFNSRVSFMYSSNDCFTITLNNIIKCYAISLWLF
jgi:hypothetical protein